MLDSSGFHIPEISFYTTAHSVLLLQPGFYLHVLTLPQTFWFYSKPDYIQYYHQMDVWAFDFEATRNGTLLAVPLNLLHLLRLVFKLEKIKSGKVLKLLYIIHVVINKDSDFSLNLKRTRKNTFRINIIWQRTFMQNNFKVFFIFFKNTGSV